MEQDDLLRFTVGVLEKLKLRYGITGSVASSYYGEPRFTNDIDIILELPSRRVAEFCAMFPSLSRRFWMFRIGALIMRTSRSGPGG